MKNKNKRILIAKALFLLIIVALSFFAGKLYGANRNNKSDRPSTEFCDYYHEKRRLRLMKTVDYGMMTAQMDQPIDFEDSTERYILGQCGYLPPNYQ